jgi:predicted nucleic acid-binding protein
MRSPAMCGILPWRPSSSASCRTLRVVERDPKDDMIVATALAARAGYLVSGDRDLLDLDPYEGIRILTARAFLEVL